jgi:hypothetical protein
VDIPPNAFTDNLVYSQEMQLAVCRPCHMCQGTGGTQDQNKLYNSTLSLQQRKCLECDGRGYFPQFITFSKLVEVLGPLLFTRFIEQLPEIIAKAQIAVIQSVMES